jgi:hypothetical protein
VSVATRRIVQTNRSKRNTPLCHAYAECALALDKDEFVGHQLDDVRKRFGEPLEIYSTPDRELYWYSRMDGVNGHFVRNIELSTKGGVINITQGCIGYYVGRDDERNLSWIEWLEIHLRL